MKHALIFRGGWDGHEPVQTSELVAEQLRKRGMEVEISDSQEALLQSGLEQKYNVIVPVWTMGTLLPEAGKALRGAVLNGVGLGGWHGGMCDAFRNDTEWQFITGGQWVSHPGGDGISYTVNICHGSSPIVEGLSDFPVCSEHYYLHVDPSIEVLATTRFPLVTYYHISNKPVDMPVAWTKYWGNGRVFYTSLGHHDDVFDKSPNAQILMERGMLWAAEGKAYALEHGLTTERFENQAKMY